MHQCRIVHIRIVMQRLILTTLQRQSEKQALTVFIIIILLFLLLDKFSMYDVEIRALPFKSSLFFTKIYNFFQQQCINLIKHDSNRMYNVTKDSISNKCCSFDFYSSNNPEIGMTVSTKIVSSTTTGASQ